MQMSKNEMETRQKAITIKRVDGAGGWDQGDTLWSDKACQRYDSECQTIALPEGSDEERE